MIGAEAEMTEDFDLERFVSAQANGVYEAALAEVQRGRKTSHWMWFVFPQIAGLGMSATSVRYAIGSLAEATAYLADSVLGPRLVEVTEAALACLSSQHARLSPPEPRYDRDSALYEVKGFVRLKGHGECPEKIVWSGYSEPFRILPWWDGDGPGVKIKLPAMSQLKRISPNVSFEIPPKLGKVLSSDLSKVIDKEEPGGGLELGWICSFSLPIITLCAFIVLHIFLGLLNIIFQWMLWFKICIPIPKKKAGG
jgi:hypothetical protein